MSWENRLVYPFAAIVGQERMKMALLLNAISPQIGGALIRGEKGTAKSTLVRGLSVLLPEIEVVEGCPYSCDPKDAPHLCEICQRRLKETGSLPAVKRRVRVVDLPIGATEDRVVGTLDLEYAIKQGKKRFEPGILAQAHRGILYIDEVNLLNDHIVDIILDAAAMGINIVEREGVSYSHPARFILVGTMNPEEGELRPQLMDRFGMCVTVEGCLEPHERASIILKREAFDQDPSAFSRQWEPEQEKIRRHLDHAIECLPSVSISDEMVNLCCRIAIESFVAGHRADLILRLASLALAAFNNKKQVDDDDVQSVADLVLFHRRRQPPPPPKQPETQEDQQEKENPEQQNMQENREQQEETRQNKNQQETREQDGDNQDRSEEQEEQNQQPSDGQGQKPESETVFSLGEPFAVKRFDLGRDRKLHKGSGRRSRTKTATKAGRYVMSTLRRKNNDLALDATLRAAAPYQSLRKREGVAVVIESSDIREKIREKKVGNFIIFAIDASGSMGANQRMIATKGAILSLLMDAYQKRDRVGLVAFRGDSAEVLLPPTSSIELGYKMLEDLPVGGKTPLTHGLATAYQVIEGYLRKDPFIFPLLILISDGRCNVSLYGGKPVAESLDIATMIHEDDRMRTMVIDVEKKGLITFGLSRELACRMGAAYYPLEDLRADTLVQAIQGEMVGV